MRVAFVRCGSTGRSRGGGVRGLLLVGACFEVSAVEDSGDQYDDVEVVVFFCVEVVFLGLVAVRALATPLYWTRGTSCVEFGRRGFTAGRAPSRAERLRDIVNLMAAVCNRETRLVVDWFVSDPVDMRSNSLGPWRLYGPGALTMPNLEAPIDNSISTELLQSMAVHQVWGCKKKY